MRLDYRAWMAISIVLFGGAVYFWHKGDVEVEARRAARAAAVTNSTAPVTTSATATPAAPVKNTNTSVSAELRYRLANTKRPMKELERDDRAILLRNALIDTRLPVDMGIPMELKAGDDPGCYMVQSYRALDAAFYEMLRQSGAGFVSYVPNNAAVVTATPEVAAQLRSNGRVVSVLPYQPYYKLDSTLLGVVLNNESRGENDLVAVTALPNSRESLLKKLESMGIRVEREERTPFGQEFLVHSTEVVQLAQASEVLEVEAVDKRATMNDLTRPMLQVAEDSVVETNYLELTGSNIVVAVNDTGVDASHPDLDGRVFAAAGADTSVLKDNPLVDAGHGTHVASILGGSGTKSTTVTNVFGSVMPVVDKQFRGKAPKVKILAQSVDMVSGPSVSDTYLQETAAKNKAFINNNSWGYNSVNYYSMSSASYDAATRDALADKSGSQPLLFVFAAGNSGYGLDDGSGGIADSIASPANAKNVIAVGALESPRNITNKVAIDGVTNAIWEAMTDTSSDVAGFSSRGNVGVGVEGTYGRFKPDVVAPGVFIVAARSTKFQDPNAEAEVSTFTYLQQSVKSGGTNVLSFDVPENGVMMSVALSANSESPNPFPTNLIILADTNSQPQTVQTGTFTVTNGTEYIGVYNPNNYAVSYDINVYLLITNGTGDKFEVLSNLNSGLGPYYRYESGTSMAAPAVSGTLALMMEFLNKMDVTNPSPALLKALLINGARPTSEGYTYGVKSDAPNQEGWGVVRLANSVRSSMTKTNSGSLQFFDQDADNALVTGQSHVRRIKVAETNYSLRVTLVWTDPPGNPACGVKLVNDLDLVVSNTATGEVLVGNNFLPESFYTTASTNIAESDVVNNVENVYINAENGPIGSEYDIIVKGKRVNVNAVTAHTNGIAQDYALVISSGSSTSAAPFVVDSPTVEQDATPWVMSLTNGTPLLYQHVGANSPLIDWPLGTNTQWRFFVFTNVSTPTNTPYVALMTFMPPNLSTPRNSDADIDLYVSTDPSITNLNATALANADKSVKRGGTEVITYSNSAPGTVYYCGVKAEDQKAAEFGFLAIASDEPFSQKDANGNIVARGMPVPTAIPDGTAMKPSKTPIFAIAMDSDNPASHIRRVTVEQKLSGAMNGDYYSTLGHGSSQSGDKTVINNHINHGTNLVVFDDNNEVAKSIHTDGPGSLRQYVGDSVNGGAWVFWLWDTAAAHTGTLETLNVLIAPRPEQNLDFYVTLDAYSSYFDYIDIPTDATNLTIAVTFQSGSGPVNISLRKGDYPPPADVYTNGISAPGGALNLSSSDSPVSLSGGRWFYQLYNNSASQVTLHVVITIQRRMVPDLTQTFVSTNAPSPLVDDANTNATIYVPVNQNILAASVGVRLDHPRVSDLAISLTSPQGTRVLLFEDRGGTDAKALGMGTNNYVYAFFTDGTNVNADAIKFAIPPYGSTNGVIPESITLFENGFETTTPTTYTNGQVVDGWTVESSYLVTNTIVSGSTTTYVVTNMPLTNKVSVLNDTDVAYAGKRVLALGSGRVSRVETNLVAGAAYRLSYAYRGDGITNWWPGDGKANDLIGNVEGNPNGVTYQNALVNEGFTFDGTGGFVTFGSDAGNFGTSDFSIDMWIKTTFKGSEQALFEKREVCDTGNFYCMRFLNGYLNFEINSTLMGGSVQAVLATNEINDGQFHHMCVVRNGLDYALYIDGNLNSTSSTKYLYDYTNTADFKIGNSVCVTHDATVPFSGQIDEVDLFNRALSPAEIYAIYQRGAAGKYSTAAPYSSSSVVVNGVTNVLRSSTDTWKTNAVVFVAKDTQATLELIGNPVGMLFDSIKFERMAETNYNNYFRPEESLGVLKGENAQGLWTLGILDTRTGGGIGASLLSWELQLTFSSTNVELVALTNGVPYQGTIPGNSMAYFGVDVPELASFATNTLRSVNPGDPLSLLFNQSGLPTGDLPGDATLLPSVQNGTYTLGLGTLPVLLPGQRYFLGVYNTNATAQTYTLNVTFDVTTNMDLVVLTNSVAYDATLSMSNSTIQYYAYDVSSDASMVAFEVLNPTSDYDLVIRHKLPLPGDKNFDYISSNPGVQDEMILVRTNSAPVPLSSGRWYIGVYGYDGANAGTYSVRATEWNSGLVVLTNGVPYTNTIPTNGVRFFAVDVPQLAVQETNTLTSLGTGKLGLYFNQTALPSSGNNGDVPLLNQVTSGTALLNAASTPELQPGLRYYLAVTNAGASQRFKILVGSLLNTNVTIVALTNTVPYTNIISVTSRLQYYSFNVDDNASRAQFDILNPSGDVGLVLRKGLPLPDRASYDAISDNSGNNDETIIVSTNGTAVTLSGGQWYLAVYNKESALAVTYQIRASEWLTETNVVVLTNKIDYSATIPSNSVCYFAVDVPWEVVSVTNLLASDAPVSLYYSMVGLPSGNLPGDYLLFDSVTNDFSLVSVSGTTPALQPGGRYYLALKNSNATNVTYAIRVDFDYTVTALTNGVSFDASFPGSSTVQYYSYDVSTNAAGVVFSVTNLTGDVDLIVKRDLPLPTLSDYDYISAGNWLADEQIFVLTNSTPVGLTPGRWYLGVTKQAGSGTVNYSINAFEWATPPQPPLVLTNGVAYTNLVPSNSIAFFEVYVPTNALAATNTLVSVDGSNTLSLLFNHHGVPGLNIPGDYTLLDEVTNGVSLLGVTGVEPIIHPGTTYYLGVMNTNATNVEFTLQVDLELSPPVFVVPLTNAVAYSTNVTVTNSPQYYSFVVSSDATLVAFDVFGNDGDVNLYLRRGLPLPSQYSFDYASERTGTNAESILVRPDSSPVKLAAGAWYAIVVNQEAENTVNYSIRATELTNASGPVIVPLTNGVPLHSTAGPGVSFNGTLDFTYYQFVVTNDAPALFFGLINMTGNADLLVRREAYPSFDLFDYAGRNDNQTAELVYLVTNSFLPSLNGTWYVAVPSQPTNNVDFDITATTLPTASVQPSIISGSIYATTNQFGFTWNSIPGLSYTIDTSTNLPFFYELTNVPSMGTNTIFQYTFPSTNEPERYYRLRVVVPE